MSAEGFVDLIRSGYDGISSLLNGHAGGPAHAARTAALNGVISEGVPTTRHEEWKYTNVLPLVAEEYIIGALSTSDLTPADIEQLRGGLGEALEGGWAAIIVNGMLRADLSVLPPSVSGVTCEVLTDKLIASRPDVSGVYGSLPSTTNTPFGAINTSIASNGLYLHVAKGARVERPLHIVVITDVRSAAVLSAPRILVIADHGSSIDIVESHHVIGNRRSLVAGATEVFVAEEASVRHHRVFADDSVYQIGTIEASVKAAGKYESVSMNIGAAFSRSDTTIRLTEPTAEAYLFGMSVLGSKQFADDHTVVDHQAPHCHSEELYKGVYSDASSGVFNGKIFVQPHAQKTTAYQSCRSLLLGNRAQVNAKPQLEIWADDVKCSHGATTGQLDDDALFYLRSRGLSEASATALLTYAFVAEVAERVALPCLREYMLHELAERTGTVPFGL